MEGKRMEISDAAAMSPAIGSNIPKDPHDVPVEKAITAAIRNKINGKKETFRFIFSTIPAKYFPVSSFPIKSTIVQANRRIMHGLL